MLKRLIARAPARRSRERGMVLLVALVVLVAIMVAGIAMMRSVDTATLVAGNLAFQQAATNSADQGIEKAIAMLQAKSAAGTLVGDDASNGYFASMTSLSSPSGSMTWQAFWDTYLAASAYDAGVDQTGNHIYFVVHRECAKSGSPSAAECVGSPVVTTASGNSEEAGEVELNASSQTYYRITVRVSGPKRTESYVQSHIAM
jgi:Tfp pilus assembly protein PilX